MKITGKAQLNKNKIDSELISLIYNGFIKSNGNNRLAEQQAGWIKNNYKYSVSIRKYFHLPYNLRNASKIFSLFYFLPVKYRKCKCLIIFRAYEEVEKHTVSNPVGANYLEENLAKSIKIKNEYTNWHRSHC